MMGILTVLWEKWVEFRRDFYKITLAAMIAPLLYILVFGMGIQTMSHGQSYLNFLIPGVVALTTMNGSFNAIAQNLNVQRLYEKAFDQVMISPTPLWQFIAGQVIGGSLRGLYAGIIIYFTGTSHWNRTLLQWLVLPSDVFKRSCLLHHWSCRLLLCEKSYGCTALFQLCHHADGLPLQHFLFFQVHA